jgi:hypothetical protein
MQKFNLIQKIRAKTPKKNKVRGQIFTAIGTVCVLILNLIEIENIYIKTAIIILAVLTGGSAFKDATKYKK